MKKTLIFLVGGKIYLDYLNWILPMGFELTDNLALADCVFFAGGEDVSPELYGEKRGRYIYSDKERDDFELDIFNKSKDKIKIGVCRGGQFLTVVNGYRLIQHMSHPSWHDITMFDGQTIKASSSHHNQFYLKHNDTFEQSDYELLAYTNRLSNYHLDGNNDDYDFPNDYKEPEIVLFNSEKHGKSLSIQMHPEYFDVNHPTVKYLQNLLMERLFINNQI